MSLPTKVTVSAFLKNPSPAASISDSSANVFANLTALQIDQAKITGITLTDVNTPTQTLTWLQFSQSSNVLGKIAGSYHLALTGVAAGQLATALANVHVTSIAVADSAADIVSNLTNLQSSISKLGSLTITLTDATQPTLTLTTAQITADAGVLKAINSPYSLTVGAGSVSAVVANHLTSPLIVSDTAQNVINNLSILESNAGQISNIKLTDASVPTITLTTAQYNANIDALAEITSPYHLTITSSAGIAAAQIPEFTVRAPQGTIGPVTITVWAVIDGAAPVNLGSAVSNGSASVQFQATGLQPLAGDTWSISATVANAKGNSVPGQVEITPGFFVGETNTSAYGASVNVKFLSVSATGAITGLPTTYSATDNSYYVLDGASGNALSLTALAAADKSSVVLQKYIAAGRVAVLGVDGAVQPVGENLTSPSVQLNGNTNLANLGNLLNAGQNAILVNIPSLANNTTVQMWLSDGTNSYLLGSQALTTGNPYAGFSGANLNINGVVLPAGAGATGTAYTLFFTDASGNGVPGKAISGLQLAIAPPAGGAAAQWISAPSSTTGGVTLEVGTVQQIEAYAASKPSGTIWYFIEDSISNIQQAGSGLNALIAGQHLIGAYVSGGIAPAANGYQMALWPSAVQIAGTQQYIRVFGTDTGNWQTHTVLAVQTTAPANTSHSIQLFDNGKALGGIQTLTADGSGTLGIPLSAGVSLSTGTTHNLTVKVDGTFVNIGTVPPGGGLPTSYAAGLNVWVGTVSQLPASLSAVSANTLYLIQDSAQNLAALGSASVETGVVLNLAAGGNLAFELTDSQLSSFQQQLIEANNLNIVNFSTVTIADTLLGMEHVPVLGVGDSLLVHDDIAHLLYAASAIAAAYPTSGATVQYDPLSHALTAGQVVLTDSLVHLVNSSNLAALQNLQTAGISALSGIVVSDTVADYQAQLVADKTSLQGLATTLHAGLIYEVSDTLAGLQQAGGALSSTLQTFLQTNDANAKINVVNVLDSVSNLEAAYANGNLSTLLSGVEHITGHGLNLNANDSIANLVTLLNNPAETGLYTQLSGVTVVDTAQNILNAFQHGGNGLNPLSVANSIVINDSYANVLAASQSDTNLLGEVSALNLTSGAKAGSAALQINISNPVGDGNGTVTLPEVSLLFMSGALTATESSDNNGGTLVTISDTHNDTVAIDLIGVTDSSGTAYTHGGWYHV